MKKYALPAAGVLLILAGLLAIYRPSLHFPGVMPSEKVAAVVYLEETSDRTPAIAAVVTSKAVGEWCKANGVPHPEAVDKDRLTPTRVPLATLAEGKALPQVFLIGASGRVLWQGALPKDEAAMLALLNQYKGP